MPGWQDFLTEQDRALLHSWAKTTPDGAVARPALLIVDAYYEALGLRREPIEDAVKHWPMSCGLEGWKAVDNTVAVLDAARRHRIPVVFSRNIAGFPSPWVRWGDPQRTSLEHLPEHERRRANDIVDELAPLDGELVIEKAAPSAFRGTPLMFHLTHLGIDTLVVCGETTSGCVRSTVVDASTNRLHVMVVEDCCFDRLQASHHINLLDMHLKYGDVVDSGAAIAYMSEVAGTRPTVNVTGSDSDS
jgi:nicotinamidase-related amidase